MTTRKFGVLEEKPSLLFYDYETVCGTSTEEIPESFMLPKERIPDCRDQKTTGQCVAFSSTNILQILNEIETGERIQFSTTYAYGRHRDEGERTMEGMYVSSVMKRMCTKGSVPSTYMDVLYEVPDAYDYVNSREDIEELDRIAEKYHIKTYVVFKSGDTNKKITEVKRALMKYQIPILGVFPMGGAYHAVALIGWDDECFYFMNSWGKNGAKIDGSSYAKCERLKEAFLMLDAKNTPDFPFVDVPKEHWGYNAVRHCYNSGIVNGVDDSNFMPDAKLTKAQIAQVLYKLAQKYADFNAEEFRDVSVYYSFDDVPKEHWAYKAASYCRGRNVIVPRDKNFKPDEALTREEFCSAICNFVKRHCSAQKLINATANKIPFVDVATNEYSGAIRMCYALGLINGVDETHFAPKEHLTRAQLCQIVYKLIKAIEEYEA